MAPSTSLIFVYNADSGSVTEIRDALHKIVSPKTYICHLCALTHGFFAEKNAWKQFRNTSEVDMVFLHKDQFMKRYRSKMVT